MWKPKVTMEEFEADYCQASQIGKAYYNERFVTLPCDCDEKGCRGWVAIHRKWEFIQHQLGFCLPSQDDLISYFP